jgi:hypothetical protein
LAHPKFKLRYHPVIRSVSSLAISEGASAIVSEVIVSLRLSYLIPGFHHNRRKSATARGQSDDALALHREITGFATGSSTAEAC